MRVYVRRSFPWTPYILVDPMAHADCGAGRRWYTWFTSREMIGTTHRWEPSLTGSDRLPYPWMRRSVRSDCRYSRDRRVLRQLFSPDIRATVSPCQEQMIGFACSYGYSRSLSACSSSSSHEMLGMLRWMCQHRLSSLRLPIFHISSELGGLYHSTSFYSLMWAHSHLFPGNDPWARGVSILLGYPASRTVSKSPSRVWFHLVSVSRYLVLCLSVHILLCGHDYRRVTFSRHIVDDCRCRMYQYCHTTRYTDGISQHWYGDSRNLEDTLMGGVAS